MSPYKSKAKSITVLVPRHNSQRIGPVLTTHVEKIAKKDKKRTDVRQTAYDPQSILAQAIVSAHGTLMIAPLSSLQYRIVPLSGTHFS